MAAKSFDFRFSYIFFIYHDRTMNAACKSEGKITVYPQM